MPHIEPLGDSALLLRFGDGVDAAINQRVHACAAALHAWAPAWLLDVTPAHASLAVHIDTNTLGGTDPLDTVHAELASWLAETRTNSIEIRERFVEIPVLYGGDSGPDLEILATLAGMNPAEVVTRHTAAICTVAMLGFAPGFPYLLGLDPALAMPRRANPRARVEAGSVGIGGAQTGIYPAAGPGGWRIIGRTPLRLFDAARDPPSLLQAGDRVRFVAIDAAHFAPADRRT